MKYLGRVASNTADKSPTLWVSQTCARKGSRRALRDGVDWGYTSHSPGWRGLDAPMLLSPYWERRFKADMRRVGANVIEHEPKITPFYPDDCYAR